MNGKHHGHHQIIVRMSSDCDPTDSPHIKALIGSLVDIHTHTNDFYACYVESITRDETGDPLCNDMIVVTTDYEMDEHLEGVTIPFKNIEQITYL